VTVKTPISFLTLAALLLASCTSTRYVTGPRDRADVNDRAREEPARVFIRETTPQRPIGPYDATNLRLRQDSVVWFDERTLTMVAIPTQSVAAIEFTSHSEGLGNGLSLGILGGGLAGALGGYIAPTCYGRGVSAILVGLSGAIVGGVTGMLIGATAGSRDRYEISETPQP
jgi:hypothetical protein